MTLAEDRPAVPGRAVEPPARPAVARETAVPVLGEAEAPRPRRLSVAVAATSVGLLAGLVAMGAMAADGAGLKQRLTDLATASDPTASDDLVRSGVRTVLLSVFAVQSALILLGLLWLLLVLRRRSWARALLVVTGVLTAVVAGLAQDVVEGGSEVDRWAFVVEAGALLVAVVLLCSRPVGAWLRARPR